MFQMIFRPTNSGRNLLARLLGISILGTEAGQFGVVRMTGIYETEIVKTGHGLPARPEYFIVLDVYSHQQELSSFSHQSSLSVKKLGIIFLCLGWTQVRLDS